MQEILLYGVIKLTLTEIETGCFLPQNTLIQKIVSGCYVTPKREYTTYLRVLLISQAKSSINQLV